VVTVVGVACRGQIPLEDIRVDFQVEPLADSDVRGFGVRKTVTVSGPLSDTQHLRLRRAAEYCPVGQLFTKGASALEDQVVYSEESALPDAAVQAVRGREPSLSPPQPVPPGTVHGRYLADTKAYDARGVLQHEGEVKVYLTCANRTRTGRWTLLAGHSAEGWMPPPIPLVYAALAASTVTTLQQRVPPTAWPPRGFHVEIAPHAAGNREHAQAAAAAGMINARQVVRTVVLDGAPPARSLQTIEAALKQDPLATSFRAGGMLLGEEIVAS
jgi:uncharacterized OsmC-like protein